MEKTKKLVTKITNDFQDLENLIGGKKGDQISLPMDIVKSTKDLLPNYHFIQDNTLRRNLTYSRQSVQFYRWILWRFKVYGPIKSYLYKTGIILVNAMVEAMTHDFLEQMDVKPNKSHSKNIKKLKDMFVPKKTLAKLKALHNRRSNIHMYLISDLENDKYSVKDWNEAIRCRKEIEKTYKKILQNKS